LFYIGDFWIQMDKFLSTKQFQESNIILHRCIEICEEKKDVEATKVHIFFWCIFGRVKLGVKTTTFRLLYDGWLIFFVIYIQYPYYI
jgi:hypothetical protein